MTVVIGNIPADDVRAIEALLVTSAWLIDHGQADQLPATLSHDGEVHEMGPEPMDHAAFTEWANQRAANTLRQIRHVISNTRLFAMDDGRVHGASLVTIWAAEGADPQLSVVGDWEDIYVKTSDGRWLIHERRLVAMSTST